MRDTLKRSPSLSTFGRQRKGDVKDPGVMSSFPYHSPSWQHCMPWLHRSSRNWLVRKSENLQVGLQSIVGAVIASLFIVPLSRRGCTGYRRAAQGRPSHTGFNIIPSAHATIII